MMCLIKPKYIKKAVCDYIFTNCFYFCFYFVFILMEDSYRDNYKN